MAFLEQLVFGFHADADQRRVILGQSPDLGDECAREVVRLCEDWGAVPVEGLRRPVLLSFPLETRLDALPGDLHVVIRITEGFKPVYHAVVISLHGYQEFDLNPYTLAQENVFLDAWEPGRKLSRRELRPDSLAPLVSPPPGPNDLGSIDEAVRQMLANRCLLLPLERTSSDSDRFLALTIAGLPRVLRRDLRFAAWAPAGTNRYTLAATARESALFTSWQPFLMTAIVGDIGPTCDEYLVDVRRCLAAGDLAGLEQVSAAKQVELIRPGAATARTKPRPLTAMVQTHAAHKVEWRLKQQVPSRPAGRSRVAAMPAAVFRPLHPDNFSWTRPSRPRRPRYPSTGRLRRALALALSSLILLTGGFFLWTSGHWQRLPATIQPASPGLRLDPQLEVVDVAHLYRRLLAERQQVGGIELPLLEGDQRRRGLGSLQQAGLLLTVQGQDYLATADRILDDPGPERQSLAQPRRVLATGNLLASELRRLVLAQVAFGGQAEWRDLAQLDRRGLRARLDSLLVHRRQQGPLEPSLFEFQQLLIGVDQRTRQLGGLVELEDLLARPAWDPDWTRRCETAISRLAGTRHGRARQLREDAFLLVRLKRAEQATDLAALAFAADHRPLAAADPAVTDALSTLRERNARPGRFEPPSLLAATVELYAALEGATGLEAPVELLAAVCEELGANGAARFDPSQYGDHLARLRFTLLQRLVAAGTAPEALPTACFSDGPSAEHLRFLELLAAAPEADAWRQEAAALTDPFLIRWALHLADPR